MLTIRQNTDNIQEAKLDLKEQEWINKTYNRIKDFFKGEEQTKNSFDENLVKSYDKLFTGTFVIKEIISK